MGDIERELRIVDTTLRDGEQTAGVVFSNKEKRQIARLLDEAGIYQIEAGVPAMKGDEKQAIKEIVEDNLNASILGWCRAVADDVKDSIDCGLDAVCVSVPISDVHIEKKLKKDRRWVHDHVARTINFAKIAAFGMWEQIILFNNILHYNFKPKIQNVKLNPKNITYELLNII